MTKTLGNNLVKHNKMADQSDTLTAHESLKGDIIKEQ